MAKVSNSSKAPTASAPARTTRQTRSQSVEPTATAPEPATTGAVRRRGARTERASSEQLKGEQKKNKNAPPAIPDLTTVQEDEDNEDDDDDGDGDEDAQLQAHTLSQSETAQVPALQRVISASSLDLRRISSGSAISGTTAKTSFSNEEIEQMDPEVMIDVLPTLATTADQLANFLAPQGPDTPPEIWKEIRRIGSKHFRIYTNRQSPFNFYKRNFGSQEYIRPRTVLRALLGVQSIDELLAAPWRPDNILLKANLAEMLNTVLVVCDTDEWTDRGSDALERLHAAFAYAIAGREFSFNTLDFYLDLTAQLTIRRMDVSIESEHNLLPHSVIDNLFYDDAVVFRHVEDMGLLDASDEDRERALEMIDQMVADLKQPFQENGMNAIAANGRLKAKYVWQNLKTHTLKYFEARANQLNKRITKAGGIPQILSSLTREVERRADERLAAQIKQSRQKTTSTPRASLAGIAALKQMEDDADEREPVAKDFEYLEPSEPAESVTAPEVDAPEVFENLEPSEPVESVTAGPEVNVMEQDFAARSTTSPKATAQPAARSKFQIASSYQARQIKRQQQSPQQQRRRFIDPQPNAERLVWSENEETQRATPRRADEQGTQSRPSQSPAKGKGKGKGKRAYVESEDENDIPDPTQDEGFQMDTRDLAAANRRRKEVSFSRDTVPAPRHASIDPVSISDPRSSMAQDGRPSPSKRQRLNPGSSITPLNAAAPPGSDLPSTELYARAKVYSRQFSAVANASKMPQVRRPWTSDEEDALINLIEEHGSDGISYATLKNLDSAMEDDARLSRRSAEDLRFKARNMKVTWLIGSSGQENLPPNWEHVMLDKKAIDKLHKNGINYTQDRQRLVQYGGVDA